MFVGEVTGWVFLREGEPIDVIVNSNQGSHEIEEIKLTSLSVFLSVLDQ